MTDPRNWFSAAAGRRITVEDIGGFIGVSRATATRYLADGLTADHVITIARSLGINPATALVELDYLTVDDVHAFLDGSGQLVETADDDDLILELAARLVPPRKLEHLFDAYQSGRATGRAAAESATDPLPIPGLRAFPVVADDTIEQQPKVIRGVGHDELPAVADSSPDEPEEGTDFD